VREVRGGWMAAIRSRTRSERPSGCLECNTPWSKTRKPIEQSSSWLATDARRDASNR
jgi:hypothetical protein